VEDRGFELEKCSCSKRASLHSIAAILSVAPAEKENHDATQELHPGKKHAGGKHRERRRDTQKGTGLGPPTGQLSQRSRPVREVIADTGLAGGLVAGVGTIWGGHVFGEGLGGRRTQRLLRWGSIDYKMVAALYAHKHIIIAKKWTALPSWSFCVSCI
jgi:hypothetical protein